MNILVIQNRMGIGDMVIFLPFIEAISKKYNSPITLLIKESTKAREYTSNLNFIKSVTDVLYFFEIASTKGKKITMSPIPIRFCITSIFICFYNLY